MNAHEATRWQRAAGRISNSSVAYPPRHPSSSTFARESPPYHRDQTPPQSPSIARAAWLDRAGEVLAGLLVALQGECLSTAEQQAGWAVFGAVLDRYVATKHQESLA
jgi:hypothetical protein